MKKIVLISTLLLIAVFVKAQNSVGIGTTTPNPNAALDIVTTNQGLLIPRLDTATILAMPLGAADDGMMVYADEINAFAYWDGDSLDWYFLNENVMGGGSSDDNDWYFFGDTLYNNSAYVVVGNTSSFMDAILTVRDDNGGTSNLGVFGEAENAADINIGVVGHGIGNATDTTAGVIGIADDVQVLGVGVRGEANVTSPGSVAFGGSFEAIDHAGNSDIRGLEGQANGTVSTLQAIGLHASATGAMVNWAGFFDEGNVYIQNNLGINQNSPAALLHVNGEAIVGNTGLSCSAATAGALRYNGGSGEVEYCNGTIWISMGGTDTDWTQNSTKVYNLNDSIGIGTSTPNNKFEVDNFISFQDNIRNTSIGYQSGELTTLGASDNTYLGYQAGSSATSGFYNTFIGSRAGRLSANSDYNVFVGAYAGENLTSGEWNVHVGTEAGRNSNGFENTFVGNEAGSRNTSGEGNTFLGNISGTNNQTGFYNTILGSDANVASANLLNSTAIGYKAYAAQNNSIVLGSIAGINGASANVNVGIGTNLPTDKLHIVGTSGNTLRIEDGNQALGRVLTSDANGNASWAAISGTDTDWTENVSYVYNNTKQIVVGNSSTIASYQMEIETNTRSLGLMVDNNFTGATQTFGVVADISPTGTGPKYGFQSVVRGNASQTNPILGIFNQIGAANNETAYGTWNNFDLSNGHTGIQYGTFNDISNNGTGNKFGSYSDIDQGSGGNEIVAHYGILNHDATGNSISSYNNIIGGGSGNQWGTYNQIHNLGTGRKIGTNNSIQQGAIDNPNAIKGTRNWIITNSTTNQDVFGEDNLITNNTGAGNSYGVYNSFNGSTTGTEYGIYSQGEDYNYFSGDVGVGVSAPISNLHIYEPNYANTKSEGTMLDLNNFLPDSRTYIRFSQDGSLLADPFYIGVDYDFVQFDMYTDDALPMVFSNSGNERMRIHSNGNVGVGMSNPHDRLTVEGTIGVREQTIIGTPPANYGKFYAKTDNKPYFMADDGAEYDLSAVDGNGIYDGSGTLSSTAIITQNSNDVLFHLSGVNSNFQIRDAGGFNIVDYQTSGNANWDNGTMFLDGTNNRIGIGNTAPNYNLDVSGDARVGYMGSSDVINVRPNEFLAFQAAAMINNIGALGVYSSSGGSMLAYINIPVGYQIDELEIYTANFNNLNMDIWEVDFQGNRTLVTNGVTDNIIGVSHQLTDNKSYSLLIEIYNVASTRAITGGQIYISPF